MQAHNISIPTPVKTRWNSQYNTVCRILEIPHALLNELLRDVGRSDLVLSNRDINLLQEFAAIFALFAEATTRTQAERSASISFVAPSILAIYFDLHNEEQSCKFLGGLCRALLTSLRERFGGLLERCGLIDTTEASKNRSTYDLYRDDLYLIAPFLDGHFKMKWLKGVHMPEATTAKVTDLVRALVVEAALQLHGSVNDSCDNLVLSPSVDLDTSDSEMTSSLPTFKRKRLFSTFSDDGAHLTKKTRSSVIEMIQDEVSLFIKETSDDSRLVFKKKQLYPYLHRVAVRVFCVPATSAPVERVFSSSGIIMRPHRSRLTKNMLSTLTLLKCNHRLI